MIRMDCLTAQLTRQHIELYYRWLLERPPEPSVVELYLTKKFSRAELLKVIVDSDEFAKRLQRAQARNPWAALNLSPGR